VTETAWGLISSRCALPFSSLLCQLVFADFRCNRRNSYVHCLLLHVALRTWSYSPGHYRHTLHGTDSFLPSFAQLLPLLPPSRPTNSSRVSTTFTPTVSSTATSSPRTCSSTRRVTSNSPTLDSLARSVFRYGRTRTRHVSLSSFPYLPFKQN
jgi:hypothetical protein